MSSTPEQQRLAALPSYAGSAAQQAYDYWFAHCRGCPTCKAGSAGTCAERAAAWQAYLDAGGPA